MSSKVCDTHDLLNYQYRELVDDFIRLSNDGTPDWRANNHVLRAWEYSHAYLNLDLGSAKRLLDVGSENSLFSIWIKKRHPDLQIVCVDPGMDGRLAHRAAVHGVELEMRKEKLSQNLGRFDRITCFSVLEHVPDDEDVVLVNLMAQMLEPGGILVITVDYGPSDVVWPQRTVNVIGGGRMYGREMVWNRIIGPSGLKLVGEKDDLLFAFHPLDNAIPGIDPLGVPYTSICIVLRKE